MPDGRILGLISIGPEQTGGVQAPPNLPLCSTGLKNCASACANKARFRFAILKIAFAIPE